MLPLSSIFFCEIINTTHSLFPGGPQSLLRESDIETTISLEEIQGQLHRWALAFLEGTPRATCSRSSAQQNFSCFSPTCSEPKWRGEVSRWCSGFTLKLRSGSCKHSLFYAKHAPLQAWQYWYLREGASLNHMQPATTLNILFDPHTPSELGTVRFRFSFRPDETEIQKLFKVEKPHWGLLPSGSTLFVA